MIGAAAAGRSKVLISFSQVSLELLVVLGELGDLLPELARVVGLAETGLAPGLFAERLGQALLELTDAGGQAGGALAERSLDAARKLGARPEELQALALLRDASTNRGDTSAADAAAARAAGVRAKLTGNIADRSQRPPHVDGPDFSISP